MLFKKIQYLARSAAFSIQKESKCCPNCGSCSNAVLDRKYLVTKLVRCADCQLMFRTPIDRDDFNFRFYNHQYTEGTTTKYPSDQELEYLKSIEFEGSEQNYKGYISFLGRYGIEPGMRLFDFGCSWGYGSYQMAKAGYDVRSYEIGTRRRNYGIQRLGVKHIDEPFEINTGHPLHESFDCFFSAHVLEHVPSPGKIFDLAWRCLKPGGAFVAFTPNGNEAFRLYNDRSWHKLWGAVHPNFLDKVFYERHFARSKRQYDSRDGSDVNKQYELGFVAWKNAAENGF